MYPTTSAARPTSHVAPRHSSLSLDFLPQSKLHRFVTGPLCSLGRGIKKIASKTVLNLATTKTGISQLIKLSNVNQEFIEAKKKELAGLLPEDHVILEEFISSMTFQLANLIREEKITDIFEKALTHKKDAAILERFLLTLEGIMLVAACNIIRATPDTGKEKTILDILLYLGDIVKHRFDVFKERLYVAEKEKNNDDLKKILLQILIPLFKIALPEHGKDLPFKDSTITGIVFSVREFIFSFLDEAELLKVIYYHFMDSLVEQERHKTELQKDSGGQRLLDASKFIARQITESIIREGCKEEFGIIIAESCSKLLRISRNKTLFEERLIACLKHVASDRSSGTENLWLFVAHKLEVVFIQAFYYMARKEPREDSVVAVLNQLLPLLMKTIAQAQSRSFVEEEDYLKAVFEPAGEELLELVGLEDRSSISCTHIIIQNTIPNLLFTLYELIYSLNPHLVGIMASEAPVKLDQASITLVNEVTDIAIERIQKIGEVEKKALVDFSFKGASSILLSPWLHAFIKRNVPEADAKVHKELTDDITQFFVKKISPTPESEVVLFNKVFPNADLRGRTTTLRFTETFGDLQIASNRIYLHLSDLVNRPFDSDSSARLFWEKARDYLYNLLTLTMASVDQDPKRTLDRLRPKFSSMETMTTCSEVVGSFVQAKVPRALSEYSDNLSDLLFQTIGHTELAPIRPWLSRQIKELSATTNPNLQELWNWSGVQTTLFLQNLMGNLCLKMDDVAQRDRNFLMKLTTGAMQLCEEHIKEVNRIATKHKTEPFKLSYDILWKEYGDKLHLALRHENKREFFFKPLSKKIMTILFHCGINKMTLPIPHCFRETVYENLENEWLPMLLETIYENLFSHETLKDIEISLIEKIKQNIPERIFNSIERPEPTDEVELARLTEQCGKLLKEFIAWMPKTLIHTLFNNVKSIQTMAQEALGKSIHGAIQQLPMLDSVMASLFQVIVSSMHSGKWEGNQFLPETLRGKALRKGQYEFVFATPEEEARAKAEYRDVTRDLKNKEATKGVITLGYQGVLRAIASKREQIWDEKMSPSIQKFSKKIFGKHAKTAQKVIELILICLGKLISVILYPIYFLIGKQLIYWHVKNQIKRLENNIELRDHHRNIHSHLVMRLLENTMDTIIASLKPPGSIAVNVSVPES